MYSKNKDLYCIVLHLHLPERAEMGLIADSD